MTAEEETRKRTQDELPDNWQLQIDAKKLKDNRVKGIASIKPEYILSPNSKVIYNDDEAESSNTHINNETNDKFASAKKGKRAKKGQNKNRDLTQKRFTGIRLCPSLYDPEDESRACVFGVEQCRYSHNLEEYLAQKPEDLPGVCPAFEELGYCYTGFKCRWLNSHYDKETKKMIRAPERYGTDNGEPKPFHGEVNWISSSDKGTLQKKRFEYPLSETYLPYLDSLVQKSDPNDPNYNPITNTMKDEEEEENKEDVKEDDVDDSKKVNQATYIEAPFKMAEKKKLNIRGAKIVSPLTTVGNLPYRRLMRTLGADVTYSEMAFGLPIMQGSISEWALPKAHESEYPGYGVQIATSKHWQACKSVEAITKLTTHVSEINLNCGCPIDLLYRQGQGSALLDNPARLVRLLKGMNATSGDVPITVKIRMGTKEGHPTAENLVKRVLKEGDAAAITIHGRSRQQRYTKEADWDYISKIGSVVQEYNADQVEDKDSYDKPPVYLIGNGDCFTYEDWYKAIDDPGIDSVMVARGALIKPWIFEEVEAQQYLDKSATERLAILEKYAKFAITHWSSDAFGLNNARRFLCEFLSFTHRYIPVGILERMPPKLNDRPPLWKGRNELETLLASTDYKDWIKITEMFLGPADDDFVFTPKHKSNSYENN